MRWQKGKRGRGPWEAIQGNVLLPWPPWEAWPCGLFLWANRLENACLGRGHHWQRGNYLTTLFLFPTAKVIGADRDPCGWLVSQPQGRIVSTHSVAEAGHNIRRFRRQVRLRGPKKVHEIRPCLSQFWLLLQNTIDWWFKWQPYFSHSLEAGNSKIKGQVDLVSGDNTFSGLQMAIFLLCPNMVNRERGSILSCFFWEGH